MLRLVAFVSIVTLSSACRQQPAPTSPCPEDTSPEDTTELPVKVKSPQTQAQVIIETYQDFDEKKTSIYMKAIISLAELHARRFDSTQRFDAKPMNIDGKFAVVFTIYDVECSQLRKFISTVEGLSERTKKVTIKCGGSTTYL
uniref:Lipoprotein n=1 Tax=Haemonchus contortus TaxID=6289 RepID=A0A7I4YF23_HAECO